MDFQTSQHEAKQNTTQLIVLLALGVLAIILIVSLLLVGLFWYGSGEFQFLEAFILAAPLTTIGIVGASLVKSGQIRGGGGAYVATSLGGRQVDFNTLDPAEKQLSNIVEEIAIASGMPVPAVFVMDQEQGINAFAAGWTADNAAVAVTRGALEQLNRRELQGVIAHEFAHIRNGDMRIKTRIIGWVFGIAIVTVLGRILLHNLWWTPRSRNREDNSALVLLAVGFGLVAVGAIGSMFARMVQSAVSRQREYLADASAVQYTRDPTGIGGALLKIGGMGAENRVRAAHATEAGHLFFSSAFGSSFGSAFASHPPLEDRIRRLLPDWDGEYPAPMPIQSQTSRRREANRSARGRGAGPFGAVLPGQVAIPGMPAAGGIDPGAVVVAGLAGGGGGAGAGNGAGRLGRPTYDGPTEAHIEHARSLLSLIPEQTQAFLHTRQGAVASVIGMLVAVEPDVRGAQLARAGQALQLEPAYLDQAGQVIGRLHRSLQLPAIDIALHSIRETPYEFKLVLADTIRDIEATRPDQDLFRWMLRRVMLRHLADQHDDGSSVRTRSLDELRAEAALVLAIVAWFNSSGSDQTQSAYDAALAAIGSPAQPVPPVEALTFDRLDVALDQLVDLDRPGREAFVNGATAAVLHDDRTTVEEAELVRVVADAVRLPVPPLLPA
ncbi:MAG: M48 family metallopeptidase [Actinomycetota bacterium]